MTVRTWITISALAMAALTAAVLVRLLSPLNAPPLLARAGDVRLDGVLRESCWTQRAGALRCRHPGTVRLDRGARVPRAGTINVVAAFPLQPERGTLRVTDGSGRAARSSAWTQDLHYTLEPGRYVLHADARYRLGAFVRYDFPFQVR